jgi:hypothetical protein
MATCEPKRQKLSLEERRCAQRAKEEPARMRATGPRVELPGASACAAKVVLVRLLAAKGPNSYCGDVPSDENGLYVFYVGMLGKQPSPVARALAHLVERRVDFVRLHLVEEEGNEYPELDEEEEEEEEEEEDDTLAPAPNPNPNPTSADESAPTEVDLSKVLKSFAMQVVNKANSLFYAKDGQIRTNASSQFLEVDSIPTIDPANVSKAAAQAARAPEGNLYSCTPADAAVVTLHLTGNF